LASSAKPAQRSRSAGGRIQRDSSSILGPWPAKIRKAIEEHEIDSQKKILLSRIATAKARDEVNNHPDWKLWDQRDLSQKF